MGPGVGAFEDGVGDGFGAAVGDAEGFVVGEFRGGVGGVEEFAALAFGVEFEAVVAFDAAAGGLIDVEFGAAGQFVEVVAAVAAAAALAELGAVDAVAAEPSLLHCDAVPMGLRGDRRAVQPPEPIPVVRM